MPVPTPISSHVASTSALVGGPAPPPKPGDAPLNARDAEHPKTIKGGYQMMPSHAVGGAGSLTSKNTVKNGTGGASNTSNTSTSLSSVPTQVVSAGVSAASSFVPSGVPLAELATKFNSPDTDEVTLSSRYYPQDQPLLARMVIHFPDKVDDMPVVAGPATTSSGFGNALNPSNIGTGNIFSTQGQTSTFGQAAGGSFSATSGISLAGTVAQEQVPQFNLTGTVKPGEYLEVRPNNLLGFDHQRIINGMGGKFTLTLFDPQWDLVEKRLCAAKGFFRFKYGYTDSQQGSFSPWYIARAFTYKVDFGMEGNTIVITGMTTGYSLGISKTFAAEGIKGENISEIAKKLAEAMGFKTTVIEDTRPVTSNDGLDTTDLTRKIINFTGMSHYQGIINELTKYAVNPEGQGNYCFFIRVNEDGKQEFHFHTPYYEQEIEKMAAATGPQSSAVSQGTQLISGANDPNIQVAAKEVVGGTGGTKVPAFTMFRNKNQATIRFTPNWAMSIAQLTGGGGTAAPNIDMTNKNFFLVNLDMNNNPQVFDNKNNITKIDPKDYLPGTFKTDEKLKAFTFMTLPERSQEQTKAVAQAQFSKTYQGAVTATLEIFGTPNFYLFQKIAVFIFKPQGDNSKATDSNIHWVSGFFRIREITDSIRAGKFITTFKLFTDGRGTVAPDPVPTIQSK